MGSEFQRSLLMVSSVWTCPQLENAVANGSERAEMRHRLNVAAEGNWILLGNLITVVSIGFLSSKKIGEEK